MTSTQVTSMVKSGDVTLFVRKFGAAGRTPILVLHGANYFDSADWVDVAERLAGDREVAVFDARGFGASSWSASREYGLASALADVRAVLDHLGWVRAIIVGHSRGGAQALFAAARAADRAAGLVLVDYNPALGFGAPGGTAPAATPAAPVFPTVEAALETMSRYKAFPLTASARARALQFLEPVEGGFRLFKRDPAFLSPRAPDAADATPAPRGGFDELADTHCPVLILRGAKAATFKPEDLARLGSTARVQVQEIDSGHDVVGEAPEAFIAALHGWSAIG